MGNATSFDAELNALHENVIVIALRYQTLIYQSGNIFIRLTICSRGKGRKSGENVPEVWSRVLEGITSFCCILVMFLRAGLANVLANAMFRSQFGATRFG